MDNQTQHESSAIRFPGVFSVLSEMQRADDYAERFGRECARKELWRSRFESAMRALATIAETDERDPLAMADAIGRARAAVDAYRDTKAVRRVLDSLEVAA